jgi:hypothetical protein
VPWVGCSEGEVAEVQASQRGLPLPPEYQSFLLTHGKGPGPDSYLRATGEYWYYPEVLGFGELAHEVFAEAVGAPMPEQYLVVGHYLGQQFMCVDSTSSAPLSVFLYVEGDEELEATGLDLADVLADVVERDQKGAPYRSEHIGGRIHRVILPDSDTH